MESQEQNVHKTDKRQRDTYEKRQADKDKAKFYTKAFCEISCKKLHY